MSTYSPNGRGHLMLARLEEGQAAPRELYRVAEPRDRRARRRHMWTVLNALRADGLADRPTPDAGVEITARGAQALALLRAAQQVRVRDDGGLEATPTPTLRKAAA